MRYSENKLELSIFVKPNAKKTAIVCIDEQYLHIALHAKPKEGEANRELIRFLSDYLSISKTHIVLSGGEHSRYKKISIKLDKISDTQKNNLMLQLDAIFK